MPRQMSDDRPRRERDGGNWPGYQRQNREGWAEFVNINLVGEDLENIKAWAPTSDAMSDLFDKLIESGYSVTAKWDDKSKCYTCWIKPTNDADPNMGYALSGRGSTALKAVRQVAYKHFVVCDSVWATHSNKQDKFGLND